MAEHMSLDELDKDDLKAAVQALKDWFEFQSERNTHEMYMKAFKLFKAKFNPAEYDNVE